MKRLPSLALALLAFSLSAAGQGVRMPADFLPLEVGNRWTYDVIDAAGNKAGQLQFAVEEYTIISGRSYYAVSEFPFTTERGDAIRLVRYDREERQFLRRIGDEESPLFLNLDAETEVLETDSSGAAKKFALRRGDMEVTFERGVGIIEAKLSGPNGRQTAKLSGVQSRSVSRTESTPNSASAATISPRPAAPVLPPPIIQPARRAENVAVVTSSNPRIDIGASPSPDGLQITMVVTNASDKLLPFRFNSSQTFDFVVRDATGKEVWRWSEDQFFTQVVRSDSIRASGKWQFETVWNHRDNSGKPVPSGRYTLNGLVTSLPAVQSLPFVIDVR